MKVVISGHSVYFFFRPGTTLLCYPNLTFDFIIGSEPKVFC